MSDRNSGNWQPITGNPGASTRPMLTHSEIASHQLRTLIRKGKIRLAGNRKLKIYGRLDCWSGKKRLKRENRVFFASEEEALGEGFRPCGHCMRRRR